MTSKWIQLKPQAIALRLEGTSIREIEKLLGIARSTLSGWLKEVIIPEENRQKLRTPIWKNLEKGRVNAIAWHNMQKQNRLLAAKTEADRLLLLIDFTNIIIAKLFLSSLYLGEGSKKSIATSMGNSDPLILKFFIESLVHLYKVDRNTIRFDLHLRADQDGDTLKIYWANQLNLPVQNCRTISYDKRTVGKTTYPDYKGVCLVRGGSVAIQRELVYLSRGFIKKFLRG